PLDNLASIGEPDGCEGFAGRGSRSRQVDERPVDRWVCVQDSGEQRTSSSAYVYHMTNSCPVVSGNEGFTGLEYLSMGCHERVERVTQGWIGSEILPEGAAVQLGIGRLSCTDRIEQARPGPFHPSPRSL